MGGAGDVFIILGQVGRSRVGEKAGDGCEVVVVLSVMMVVTCYDRIIEEAGCLSVKAGLNWNQAEHVAGWLAREGRIAL